MNTKLINTKRDDVMKNYKEILKLKVFNMQDINNLTHNENTSKTLIQRMLKNNYIKRIKHNLYVVCDLEYKSVIPDQYMIGSKIHDDSIHPAHHPDYTPAEKCRRNISFLYAGGIYNT